MVRCRAAHGLIILAYLLFTFANLAEGAPVAAHHFVPILDQIMKVNEDTVPEGCSEDGMLPEKSTATNEDWRRGAILPKLLLAHTAEEKAKDPSKKDLLSYQEVCDEAKAQNRELEKAGKKPRKFALVLAKMHLCDYLSKACIHAARTFFDPCNKFISENFIPFHARTYFEGSQQPTGGKKMVELYENPSGPRLTPIDLETCQPLSHELTSEGQKYREVGIDANSTVEVDGEPAWKSEDRLIRFAEMRSRLNTLFTANPSAHSKIEKREWEKSATEIGCGKNENIPTLPFPNFIPQLRRLMNEQYLQVTGQTGDPEKGPVKVRWPKQ